MLVRVMEVIHYPPDGSKWDATQTRNPSWKAIAAAIGRLDRDEWPFLWLHTGEPTDIDLLEGSLNVMGGRGEYAVSFYKGGNETHYLDKSRGKKSVRIWESDQGSVQPEKNLCNDLALVLRIAKHFAKTGELSSGVDWEE